MELLISALGALAALATVADFALSWVIPAVRAQLGAKDSSASDDATRTKKE